MNRAINVLLFSSDPFVAYLYIAYVLFVNCYYHFVCLVHRDAVVCRDGHEITGVVSLHL